MIDLLHTLIAKVVDREYFVRVEVCNLEADSKHVVACSRVRLDWRLLRKRFLLLLLHLLHLLLLRNSVSPLPFVS